MKSKKEPLKKDKAKGVRLRYFWISSKGNFSRRAFFFSLFGFIAVLYTGFCMSGVVRFHEGLSMFILACNAAFGYNYYKNESAKREPEEQKADVS